MKSEDNNVAKAQKVHFQNGALCYVMMLGEKVLCYHCFLTNKS
jgi:hypothetical protein